MSWFWKDTWGRHHPEGDLETVLLPPSPSPQPPISLQEAVSTFCLFPALSTLTLHSGLALDLPPMVTCQVRGHPSSLQLTLSPP
jgi:hypothetical protein